MQLLRTNLIKFLFLVCFAAMPFSGYLHAEISYDEGLEYLKVIQRDYPDLMRYSSFFQTMDSVIGAKTHNYSVVGKVSPSTLRYVKIAGDLIKDYDKNLKDMKIIEIGGNGVLARILSEVAGYSTFTVIVDGTNIEEVKKNSPLLGASIFSYLYEKDLKKDANFDLAITHVGQINLTSVYERKLIDRIFKASKKGYIFYKNGTNDSFIGDVIFSLNANQKRGSIVKDEPSFQYRNLKLRWEINSPRESICKEKVTLKIPGKNETQKHKAVTYSFSGGRFGDNLIAYFHAKWIALKYGYAFLYKPFGFSEGLNLHKMDQTYRSFSNFPKKITISDVKQFANIKYPCLITVPYFPESKCEYEMLKHAKMGLPFFDVDWEDPVFKKEVQECLTPLEAVKTLTLPKDCISVAVHVRRGGNHDNYENAAKGYPLKFPPDNYYIAQIKRIAQIYKDKMLYVYIFTDDLNPRGIVETYSRALNNPKLVFDFGKEQSLPEGKSRIFHDFFSMAKFDCLIRCMSNFSIVASKLGNYKVMTTPLIAHHDGSQVIVDEVEVQFKGN